MLIEGNRMTSRIESAEIHCRNSPPAVHTNGAKAVTATRKELKLKHFKWIQQEIEKEALRRRGRDGRCEGHLRHPAGRVLRPDVRVADRTAAQ
jgi:phage host-nuclease inhibitor protein Gam